MRISKLNVLFLAAALFLPAAQSARAQTKKFKPEKGVATFAVREPVLRLQPGDIVETESLNGDYYSKPGGAWPGEVGPFFIEGATTNDTLVVKILKLRTNTDHAVSTHTPGGISAIASDRYTRMLNTPIPAKRYVWKLEKNGTVGALELPDSKKRLEVPLSPMLGRVAVAPAGEEAWGGLWPGNFGGNMDVSDVREGATVYLPIFHDGAYFYFGDGHALQGDGEICGSGLETTMAVTFQFELIKGKKIAWPRIENDEYIMTVGSVRPLSDALRIAAVEMVEWLEKEYGFDRWDAYQTVSQLAVMRVGNMVDPNYSVAVKIPKRLLPK
ncbi:MAG: acetamidase/formamidase family protein [Acidobacteria bacterium]|nr:acetamidase/formamidase family protein [Acidobacteriota bacterium]MCL5289273.1 acetamidase/formamidase family protein [Acidobacteriota bacterium]